MTDDKLDTSLSANTIMAKLGNQFQRTRLITSSPDKHNSLGTEDDFRSGCRNVSHQQVTLQNYYTYLKLTSFVFCFKFVINIILLFNDIPLVQSINGLLNKGVRSFLFI